MDPEFVDVRHAIRRDQPVSVGRRHHEPVEDVPSGTAYWSTTVVWPTGTAGLCPGRPGTGAAPEGPLTVT